MSSDTDTQDQQRLAALARYDILDTPPEEAYDRVTRLARQVFDVPMSTMTLIDGHRQWFKARVGMADPETPRGPALCYVALREQGPLVVPDTLHDSRFVHNPFVTGAPHIRFYAGVQLRTPEGVAIGTLCVMDTKPRVLDDGQLAPLKDLAAIVMTELELRMLANTDHLTGALSRRAFRDDAGRAIALAVRHKHALSCVSFDLDHFKSINDTHGHAVGDLVLTACIEVCRRELRETDLVGRLGGEEFAIVLPHTDAADAMLVAEKLRAAMTRIVVPGKNGPVHVSASFGVATLEVGAVDLDELLKRADTALYEAKGAGRNTCAPWRNITASPSRRRVFKAGRITFNAGNSTIECTVRGLSDSGASLDVYSSSGVPERFKLQIAADELFRVCRVEARTDRNVDVAFE